MALKAAIKQKRGTHELWSITDDADKIIAAEAPIFVEEIDDLRIELEARNPSASALPRVIESMEYHHSIGKRLPTICVYPYPVLETWGGTHIIDIVNAAQIDGGVCVLNTYNIDKQQRLEAGLVEDKDNSSVLLWDPAGATKLLRTAGRRAKSAKRRGKAAYRTVASAGNMVAGALVKRLDVYNVSTMGWGAEVFWHSMRARTEAIKQLTALLNLYARLEGKTALANDPAGINIVDLLGSYAKGMAANGSASEKLLGTALLKLKRQVAGVLGRRRREEKLKNKRG